MTPWAERAKACFLQKAPEATPKTPETPETMVMGVLGVVPLVLSKNELSSPNLMDRLLIVAMEVCDRHNATEPKPATRCAGNAWNYRRTCSATCWRTFEERLEKAGGLQYDRAQEKTRWSLESGAKRQPCWAQAGNG